ncbi:hypothetical protein OROHE_004913 [Orobanche hederae]
MALSSCFSLLFFLILPLTLSSSQPSRTNPNTTLSLLMTIKSSLDPQNLILTSWGSGSSNISDTDPCSGSFEGVACSEHGQVVNISLQGKGLYGQIPPEVGQLKNLSGLYLHFNKLHGVVPKELANLTELSDLYLNVNDLSGPIPPEIGQMSNLQGLQTESKSSNEVPDSSQNDFESNRVLLKINLRQQVELENQLEINISGGFRVSLRDPSRCSQNLGCVSRNIFLERDGLIRVFAKKLIILQLCYNRLNGSIPTELGSMKKLSVVALQSNRLSGAIPATLGDLDMLTRLDLSFNHLFHSIPSRLTVPPLLKLLDVRNNTLSGNVPLALKRLEEGFQYANNTGLCGITFPSLQRCMASNQNQNKPEPLGSDPSHVPSKEIPESANIQNGLNRSKKSQSTSMVVIIGVIVAFALGGLVTFSWYRRRKQKMTSALGSSDSRLSTDRAMEKVRRKSPSPLISLEYSNGWDPLSKRKVASTFSQEILERYMLNLDEVESATRYFSEMNLLGKSNFSATYEGILRDGSTVAIKSISKISCKSDENEFLKGLKLLTSLKHENLSRLRGFCCSKGRGECFLVYDFVPNGNLLQYLDVKESKREVVLDWPTRKSIIKGIAKGTEYLHGNKIDKPTLVHQNISAEKILIDQHYSPLLADSGVHKLLADDIIFSTLKSSAAMGYLAPEYTTTGKFTEKSDIYAFGMIIFQILSGKSKITQLNCHGAEISRFEDFIDANLAGKFKESEAARLGEVALLCTHENPNQRPDISTIMQELDDMTS